jgi:hypothetical protein
VTAVTAVWSAFRDIFFTAKTQATVTAFTGFNANAGFIYELHISISPGPLLLKAFTQLAFHFHAALPTRM